MKTLLGIILLTLALNANAAGLEERKEHIKNMENKVSKLSQDRKDRSEKVLNEYKVPVNKFLPYIEDENEALVRTKDEVAKRAMALLMVAAKAEGLEQEFIDRLIKSYELKNVLTINENKFINDPKPSDHDRTQFIWRYEAAWVLLWALGYVEELSYPDRICDVPAAVTFMQKRSNKEFINDSKLRSISAILDQADLIYRYHWAVRDADIHGKESPASLDQSVVMERHYALNWLIGYMDQDWDNVSTDT